MSEEQNNTYQLVRGFPCPIFCPKKNVEDAMDLEPEDGDVVIGSYPKTGTTWMQYIVLQIISEGQSFPHFDDVLYKIVPYIELTGVAAVYAQDKPRLYKHHLLYDIVHKNPKSKVIYTYRHPEDAAISYYYFKRSLNPNHFSNFDSFFEHYVAGNVSYGNYFDHILSFYKHRNEANHLMVSYEKLHANRKDEILRVAKFLGEEYYHRLQEDKNVFDRILLHTSFDYMKNNLHVTHLDKKSKVDLFRKGIVGDGKAVLNDNQCQMLKEAAEKALKGTFIINEWYGS